MGARVPVHVYEPSTDGRPVISEYIESVGEEPCWHCGTPTNRVDLDFEARLCRTQCLLAKTDDYFRSLANHPASATGEYDPDVGF